MALTRANVESVIVGQVGRLLAVAELDGTTVNGTNASLVSPIAAAIRQLGYTVDSRVAITDTDVARVATDDEEEFLDLVELLTLEKILTNMPEVDVKAGPLEEKNSQRSGTLERTIARKRTYMKSTYGYGVASLTGGTLTLQINQQHEDVDEVEL